MLGKYGAIVNLKLQNEEQRNYENTNLLLISKYKTHKNAKLVLILNYTTQKIRIQTINNYA